MKIEIKKIYLLIIFVTTVLQSSGQQTFVNCEWAESSPITGNSYYHTSTIVVSGNLVVVGNILNGNGDTDIYTYRLDSNGDTLWSATYNGSATGSMDYGVELEYASGYIWVVGAAQNSGTGYDIVTLKYDATTGALSFSNVFDGSAGGDDIPTDMIARNGVFVCGGSEATNGLSDMVVFSIVEPGIAWTRYYDYANLHDCATAIGSSGSNVVVTGGSAAALGDWDLATLTIVKTSGLMSTTRTDITGATMVEAKAMTTDSVNNIYITGFAEISGDKHIQTIKLDSALSLKWIVNFDGGFEDVGNDIGIDDSGNVYVTGYSEQSNGKNKGVFIKYSDTGDTLFTKIYGNTKTENGVKFRKLAVEPNGDSYLTGTEASGGLNSFSFVKFDSAGDLKLSKSYQADTLDDDGFDIVVDSNDVYITGFTETIGGSTMRSIKYSLYEKDSALFYDSGIGSYKNRDLIVRVDTSNIIREQVDKLEIEYWDLDQIFDAGFVTSIYRVLEVPCDDETCDIKVYRIFKHQQTTDTVTTSRLGQQIKIPTFWSTFVFEFPEGVDIHIAEDSLYTLFPDIKYVDYNYILSPCSTPNDLEYYMQKSLHPTGDPDCDGGHVNVEPAWEHTVGESFVRVGVFDDGMHKTHIDFADTTGTTYKMVDGWDYMTGVNMHASPSNGGFHGAATGGILGANRNDNYGVAGIAGGDDSLSNPGVSLYDIRIMQNNEHYSSDMSAVANAIYESSIDDTTLQRGFGLNLTNNSWVIQAGSGALPTPNNINVLREQIHFANRAQVTFVAARGNGANDLPLYPAVMEDKWVLCVGGTGGDGEYYDGNSPCDGNFEISSYSLGVDVAAPAAGYLAWVPYLTNNTWVYFGGTSGATPHVTGAVALLMSYHNDTIPNPKNLAPEDSEFIVQLSADDTDAGGYDDYTGYGRLNIGRAVNMLAEDNCYIIHYGISDSTSYTVSSSQIITNDTIKFNEFYQNEDGINFEPFNTTQKRYRADVFKVTFVFTFPDTVTSDTLRAVWARHSSSSLFGLRGADSLLYPREQLEVVDVTETSATLIGYTYKVYEFGAFKGWAPYNPTSPGLHQASFTVFRCDTNLITATIKEAEPTSGIKVYPNPSSDEQLIVIESAERIDLNIVLFDASGRLVMNVYNGKTTGNETLIPVSLGNLPKGLYFYQVMLGEELKHVKIIKQ